ncbi:MAG: aquaporin [Bacteroidetes bacterium]|nr:MAG: aquaporin [Bacteroidota bacterium]
MKKFLAEAVGTFVLVFLGTGAIVLNDLSDGQLSHLGVSLSFGLAVTIMIYAFARTSGAHINPAVSLAFWANKQLERKLVLPYLLAQTTGAILASLLLSLVAPQHPTLGATLPQTSIGNAIAIEFGMSFLLMFWILYVSNRGSGSLHLAAISIGIVVALEAYFGGPFTGASMNPARSLGPALVSGNLDSLWIYFIAPISGMLFAVLISKMKSNRLNTPPTHPK